MVVNVPKKRKEAKRKTSQVRKQKYCTIGAYPAELERWKRVAGQIERPLSWWIRKVLNAAADDVEEKGFFDNPQH